ncbi:MAG TPA: hypothetical protein VHP58_00860 [Alphaproteobacteria bacterium]|nr:hypothetical protein [Alphaproteobacteria bacterium]
MSETPQDPTPSEMEIVRKLQEEAAEFGIGLDILELLARRRGDENIKEYLDGKHDDPAHISPKTNKLLMKGKDARLENIREVLEGVGRIIEIFRKEAADKTEPYDPDGKPSEAQKLRLAIRMGRLQGLALAITDELGLFKEAKPEPMLLTQQPLPADPTPPEAPVARPEEVLVTPPPARTAEEPKARGVIWSMSGKATGRLKKDPPEIPRYPFLIRFKNGENLDIPWRNGMDAVANVRTLPEIVHQKQWWTARDLLAQGKLH